jgi:hypothetical protein
MRRFPRQVLNYAASGQISAKSNRDRVIGGKLASSRQRSLNVSPAFSIGTASHQSSHGPSLLAKHSGKFPECGTSHFGRVSKVMVFDKPAKFIRARS